MQVRRLASEEPEDERFVFRWWADLQFLIVALRRLRRAADLAATAEDENGRVRAALQTFDRRLPALTVMRNVGEHLDAYGGDSVARHLKTIDRRQLQVGTFDGHLYRWLLDEHGHWLELDVDEAKAAAEELLLDDLSAGSVEPLVFSGTSPSPRLPRVRARAARATSRGGIRRPRGSH